VKQQPNTEQEECDECGKIIKDKFITRIGYEGYRLCSIKCLKDFKERI
jgi:hypothetical protein